MSDGAVTQDAMCEHGRVVHDECRLCGGPGTEKHRLYHCQEWKNLKLQVSEEVRAMEELTENDNRCWL